MGKRTENNQTVLRPKERLFVEAYVANGWNATKAAIAAGYSPGAAHVQGSKLLYKDHVRKAIDARLRPHILSADKVLARLSEMATSDISEFLDENGEVDLEKLKAKGYLIKKRKLKKTTYHNKHTDQDESTSECELELYDAQNALNLIGRYHKLFKDSVDINPEGSLAGMVILVNKDELPQKKKEPSNDS